MARNPSSAIDTETGWSCSAYTIGQPNEPGRALHCNITAPGVASITFADGSVMPDLQLVAAGVYIFNYSISQVTSFTGTGTFYRIP